MEFRDVHPELAPVTLEREMALLVGAYEDYTAHVSPAQMAISLQTASYIYWLCEHTGARDVCDFGSGFTSYVLRKYAEDADYPVQVTSVDDSDEWLGWTERFLARHGYVTDEGEVDGLTSWDDYRRDLEIAEFGTHDLIVYDFGGGDTRNDNMGYALDRLSNPGFMVLDDLQQPTHQDHALKECESRKIELLGLHEWTHDQFERWAGLAIRGGWSL